MLYEIEGVEEKTEPAIKLRLKKNADGSVDLMANGYHLFWFSAEGDIHPIIPGIMNARLRLK